MIKKIQLSDFRGFVNLDIELRPKINLLIGDNASGKTSIIKACQYVLGTFFHGFSSTGEEVTKWGDVTPKVSDFRDRYTPEGEGLSYNPIQICFDASYEGQVFTDQILRKNTPKGSRALTSTFPEFKKYSQKLAQEYSTEKEGRRRPLPLFACYTTEDIHTKRRVSYDLFIDLKRRATFGYYSCLVDNAFLDYWHKRMLVLTEAGENERELNLVRQAIMSTLGGEGCGLLQGYDILINKKTVRYHLSDGRIVEADKLSDGYKRVLSIVVDLAFRAAILNASHYGMEAISRTEGTVLIDEIDLHLHPTIQGIILTHLSRTFENLQFVVSTHAPIVMSGVEDNEKNAVFYLKYQEGNYHQELVSTYGRDANTILLTNLGTNARNAEVQNQLDALFSSIDNEDWSDAETRLNSLREHFGHNLPELTSAETILYFNEN